MYMYINIYICICICICIYIYTYMYTLICCVIHFFMHIYIYIIMNFIHLSTYQFISPMISCPNLAIELSWASPRHECPLLSHGTRILLLGINGIGPRDITGIRFNHKCNCSAQIILCIYEWDCDDYEWSYQFYDDQRYNDICFIYIYHIN